MEIHEIKSQLSLEKVLGHYNLKPNKNNMMNCPFHNDKTPSLQVYPKTNTWTCFSGNCSAGSGDQIDFIKNKEKLSKHQAIIKAKELCGYMANNTGAITNSELLSKLFKTFRNGIFRSNTAKEYLKQRNLSIELEIGYNAGQFHRAGKLNEKEIRKCVEMGMLKEYDKPLPNGKDNKTYTPFANNCIVFPMKDKKGNIVSIYARRIAPEGRTGTGKHYYLANRTGLYPAYPSREAQHLVLTESIIDAATLLQIPGITEKYEILALYGTNGLTNHHTEAVSQLKQLKEIIFFFDGDEAGKKAIEKYKELFFEKFPEIVLSQVETPENEDINSLSQGHEPEIFTQLLNDKKSISEGTAKINHQPKVNKTEKPKPEEQEVFSQLNTNNPEYITYETEELKINIWGGIEMHQVKRLRATLHLKVKSKPFIDFRDTIDLYSHNQTDRFIKQSSEKLEVSTTLISQAITTLTNQLEQYRQKEREKERKHEESLKLSESDSFSKEQLDKAQRFLESKGLTKRTFELFDQIGLIGQQKDGMLLYMIYLTRMFKNPLHAIVMGGSASGKTHLLQTVASLVPKQHIKNSTSLSENTLYYSGDNWKNRILLVEDLDGAYNALLPLRELMTNNSIGRYSTRTNKRTGEIEQIYLHVEGPVCVAGATTKDRIYEDNANRSFLIYVTEKTEHVEKVLEYQRKTESGLIDKSQPEQVTKLLKAAQLLLKPVDVIIPFGEDLRIPDYVFKKLRTNKHYLTLIKTIAFWNQKQRKWHKREDSSNGYQDYIEATIEDVEWANFLCKEALLRKSDELSNGLRDFFESLKAYQESKPKNTSSFYAREIQRHFRIYPMKLNRYLRELQTRGYIRKTGGNHKTSYEYKIVVWDDYEILQSGLNILDNVLDKLKNKYNKQLA